MSSSGKADRSDGVVANWQSLPPYITKNIAASAVTGRCPTNAADFWSRGWSLTVGGRRLSLAIYIHGHPSEVRWGNMGITETEVRLGDEVVRSAGAPATIHWRYKNVWATLGFDASDENEDLWALLFEIGRVIQGFFEKHVVADITGHWPVVRFVDPPPPRAAAGENLELRFVVENLPAGRRRIIASHPVRGDRLVVEITKPGPTDVIVTACDKLTCICGSTGRETILGFSTPEIDPRPAVCLGALSAELRGGSFPTLVLRPSPLEQETENHGSVVYLVELASDGLLLVEVTTPWFVSAPHSVTIRLRSAVTVRDGLVTSLKPDDLALEWPDSILAQWAVVAGQFVVDGVDWTLGPLPSDPWARGMNAEDFVPKEHLLVRLRQAGVRVE